LRILTLARDLRRRKAREKHHLFVAEGVRAVEELLRSPLRIRGALVAPQLREAPRGDALIGQLTARVETHEVSAAEFASAAETESPQGVLAVAEVPQRRLSDLGTDWTGVILVLDAVQDPGNVGTIVRTAAALGARATIALPGTVDLWNAKVVRSGMGAQFRHPAFASTWSELDEFRGLHQPTLPVFAADAGGEPLRVGDVVPPRLALVVGNEGAGISGEARSRAERVVSLPIAADVESLNVAVATGILLYTLTQ
jgi:TrmH family RNA methyltransferase